jgi:hypothetical protein
MSTYNGWTNWETWNANLWIDNDWRMSESFALQAGDLLSSYEPDEAIERLSGRIEEYFREQMPETKRCTKERCVALSNGFFDDVINMAMRDVNWREIAKHYVQEWALQETE